MNRNESKYFNTAKKMNDALISLLEKKDYEFITIKDICSEAHVNRSTFYLHYDNINDLLEEVISNTSDAFYDIFKTKVNLFSTNKEDLMFIKDDYLLPYLEFIKTHKKIYKLIKNNMHLFKADLYKESSYINVIDKIFDKFEIKKEYKEYVFKFYVGGFESIISKWCENDCNLEVNELANLIKGLIIKNERNFK
jgi:AcrR family transcriptional regulator